MKTVTMATTNPQKPNAERQPTLFVEIKSRTMKRNETGSFWQKVLIHSNHIYYCPAGFQITTLSLCSRKVIRSSYEQIIRHKPGALFRHISDASRIDIGTHYRRKFIPASKRFQVSTKSFNISEK